jgi:hypothetical protein
MQKILLVLALSASAVCASILLLAVPACSRATRLDRETARRMISQHASAALEAWNAKLDERVGRSHVNSGRVIEVEAVTGVALDSGEKTAQAIYIWRYGGETRRFRSTAYFVLYDDGWRIDREALVGGILMGEDLSPPRPPTK